MQAIADMSGSGCMQPVEMPAVCAQRIGRHAGRMRAAHSPRPKKRLSRHGLFGIIALLFCARVIECVENSDVKMPLKQASFGLQELYEIFVSL